MNIIERLAEETAHRGYVQYDERLGAAGYSISGPKNALRFKERDGSAAWWVECDGHTIRVCGTAPWWVPAFLQGQTGGDGFRLSLEVLPEERSY